MNGRWHVQERVAGFRIEEISAMACPKGTAPRDEVNGGPAMCRMVTPKCTLYFISRADAEMAWQSIVHKVLPLIASTQTSKVAGTKAERKQMERQVEKNCASIVEIAARETNTLLVEKQFRLAVPAALHCLFYSKRMYGAGSVDLVPCYCVLAEAYLGLQRLKPCERNLELANVIVMKSPDCPSTLRSRVHRSYGKMLLAEGRYDEALKKLAQDIYDVSLALGPEHLETTEGYFTMARVFAAQNRHTATLAFFDKVVNIWFSFLASHWAQREEERIGSSSAPDIPPGLDEKALYLAKEMMDEVLDTRRRYLGELHIATGEVKYTQGMLALVLGERAAAIHCLEEAAECYQQHLGDHDPATSELLGRLKQLREDALLDESGAASPTGGAGWS